MVGHLTALLRSFHHVIVLITVGLRWQLARRHSLRAVTTTAEVLSLKLNGLFRAHIAHPLQFLLFLADLHLHLEDVILEVAFLLRTVWENHLAVSVLNAFLPFALITATIGPVHLSIPVSLVFLVLSFVDVATSPLEYTVPVLLVSQIVTFVAIALRTTGTPPLSFAFLHPGLKLAHVASSIGPCVLSLAFGFSVDILSCVGVTVNEDVGSSAVLQANVPFTLIAVTILPCVYTIAVGLALVPLSYVTVVKEATPDSVAVLQTG